LREHVPRSTPTKLKIFMYLLLRILSTFPSCNFYWYRTLENKRLQTHVSKDFPGCISLEFVKHSCSGDGVISFCLRHLPIIIFCTHCLSYKGARGSVVHWGTIL
jgi:hypothetical protein